MSLQCNILLGNLGSWHLYGCYIDMPHPFWYTPLMATAVPDDNDSDPRSSINKMHRNNSVNGGPASQHTGPQSVILQCFQTLPCKDMINVTHFTCPWI